MSKITYLVNERADRARRQLYNRMIGAQVVIEHSDGDLFVPVNELTTAIIERFDFRNSVRTFNHAREQRPWYAIPFAYQPYWDDRAERRAHRRKTVMTEAIRASKDKKP